MTQKSACSKCGVSLVEAHIGGAIKVTKAPAKVLGAVSDLLAYVCPRCGFTEWYAARPEVFKQD